MSASGKTRSRLHPAFQFFTLATTAGVLETLLTGAPGLVTAAGKVLADLAGNVAANLIDGKSRAAKLTRALLTGDHLRSLPGRVLSALTSDFAESAASGAEQKALRSLAASLPAWCDRVRHEDAELAAALDGRAFTHELAKLLTDPAVRSPLTAETVDTLLAAALRGGPAVSDGLRQRLAAYIADSFPRSFAALLTSGAADTQPAFREAILECFARTISGIQSLSAQNDSLFTSFITACEGLDTALQTLHDSLQRLEATGDDTNLRARQLQGTAADLKKTAASNQRAGRAIKKSLKGVQQTADATQQVVGVINTRSAASEKDRRLHDYLKALVAGFRGYTEIGIEKRAEGEDDAPPIWKIFVPPSCSQERAVTPQEMEDAQKGPPLTTAVQPLLPLLADEKIRRHVLLGDPGMGKSTLIQLLTAGIASGHFAQGSLARGKCLPIPIILRDIVPHLPDDPAAWNWSTLCETMLARYQRSEDAPCLYCPWPDYGLLCEELFQSPLAFFLVDGLDEIGDAAKRTAIRNAIWEGFKTYPDARWLVTSRIVGYEVAAVDMAEWWEDEQDPFDEMEYEDVESRESDVPPANAIKEWGSLIMASAFQGWGTGFERPSRRKSWHMFEVARLHYLAPFDNGQQEKFVTNWFRERSAPNPPPGLLGDIRGREHDGIRVLARVPNLLSYMAILKRDGRPLPDGRAELYMAIARAYLHSIDKAYRLSKKHGHDCPIPFEGRLRLLAILAGEMQHGRSAATVATEAENQKRRSRGNPVSQKSKEAEGNIVISESEVRALLLAPVRRLLPQSDAERELTDFLSFIGHRSGLLLPRGAGEDGQPLYGFTHLSFLEFFAACYLRDELEHENSLLLAATRARKPADDAGFQQSYLEKYPRGPRLMSSTSLPAYADRPEWQEVLIFLAEFFYNIPTERDPILEQLFPLLHSEEEIPIRTEGFDENPLPISNTAAALAIKLARDAHLALPDATRHAWFTRLWHAWLSGRVPTTNWHPSKVNALLLDHPSNEGAALAALRAAAAAHTDLTFLPMDSCPGFTDASILRELWPQLTELSLVGCTGLTAVDHLPRTLSTLYLNGCTGLTAVDHLPPSLTTLYLSSCTGLTAVDHLPRTLTTLVLNGCTGLSAADHLPPTLTTLVLDGCTGLTAVDHLPPTLTELYLTGCTGLTAEARARVRQALPGCKIHGLD